MIKSSYTPTQELYREGVPCHVERVIQHDDVDICSPAKEKIDWPQQIDMADETRYAVCSAISHYHYVKTCNVLVCDHILSQPDVSEPVRRLARQILQRNAEEMDGWSEYIKHCHECGPMGSVQHEYDETIWEQEEPIRMLIGVETINRAADTAYSQFTDGEKVFLDLSKTMLRYNRNQYPAIHDSFSQVLDDTTRRERISHLRVAALQTDIIQLIGQERSNRKVFDHLGTSDLKLVYGAGKTIKDFYTEIGLTDGLIPTIR